MTESSFRNSADRATSLRRMKFLVVLLIVSNLATGILGVYLLRKVDQRYSELVGQSVPALNDLRELLTDTVTVMRATHPRCFVGTERNPEKAIEKTRQLLATEETFRAGVLRQHNFSPTAQGSDAIAKTGAEFDRFLADVIRLHAAAKTADAGRLRDDQLLPAFDLYVEAIGKAADGVEVQSLSANKDYTANTRGLTAFVLGVAGWPLIATMALLLLMAGLMVVLMFVLRSRGLGDER